MMTLIPIVALALVPIALLSALGRHYETKAVRLATAIVKREFETGSSVRSFSWYSVALVRLVRFFVSTPLLGALALRARAYPRRRRVLVAFVAFRILQQRGLCLDHLNAIERAMMRWVDCYGERVKDDESVLS